MGTRPAIFLNGFVDRNNPMGHEGHFLDETLQDLLEGAGLRVVDDRIIETPWQFGTAGEAGEFCRKLFWMPSLDASEVAKAMSREVGLEFINSGVRVLWVLRRVVCDAI